MLQPDCIDFYITPGINSKHTDIHTHSDLMSDHSSLILTISDTILYKEPCICLTNKKTNWDTYRAELHNLINLSISLRSPVEIDPAVGNLNITHRIAAKIATPVSTQENTPPVFYSAEIHQAIKKMKESETQMANYQRSS